MATGPPLSRNGKEQCEHSLKLLLLCSMKEKSIFVHGLKGQRLANILICNHNFALHFIPLNARFRHSLWLWGALFWLACWLLASTRIVLRNSCPSLFSWAGLVFSHFSIGWSIGIRANSLKSYLFLTTATKNYWNHTKMSECHYINNK